MKHSTLNPLNRVRRQPFTQRLIDRLITGAIIGLLLGYALAIGCWLFVRLQP
jgi:hypothetical protein